jgi:hypothetical protein
LCLRPVPLASGRKLPECLDMITANHVIHAVEKYLCFEQLPQRNDSLKQSPEQFVEDSIVQPTRPNGDCIELGELHNAELLH